MTGVTLALRPLRLLRDGVRSFNVIARRPVECEFGILLDVDGVISRGREILPFVRQAFSLLTDSRSKFRVPTVFLTNASNSMRASKAQRLSELLQINIAQAQVVMAHSPLKMFTDLHDKHVLVVGQGPVKEIANNLGFTTVTRLEDLRVLFPHLDCVDFKRRKLDPYAAFGSGFKPIDAILLLGEPLNWESALQLISDVLITHGSPGSMDYKRGAITYPHIPIIACNLDLLWMAETGLPLPRFGHGIFLLCLETVYRKLTGHELQYMAALGKPSEISYLHATHCIQRMARQLDLPSPRRLYVIGDNPESDILGSNLYDRYLRRGGKGRFDHVNLGSFEDQSDSERASLATVERCLSILVETGVYSYGCAMNSAIQPVSKLIAELDQTEQLQLRRPTFVESNLLSAIRSIFNRERYSPY